MVAGGQRIYAEDIGELLTGVSDWRQWNVQLYTGMTATRTNLAHSDVENEFLVFGKIVMCHMRITASAGSANGAGASLPTGYPASKRLVPAGSGGIYGTSPPTQSGTVAIAPSLDAVYVVSFTNGYADITTGQEFRATFWYPID